MTTQQIQEQTAIVAIVEDRAVYLAAFEFGDVKSWRIISKVEPTTS